MIEVFDYNLIKPLFEKWKYDMVIQSIEIGNTPCRMWVDCNQNPTCAMILAGIKIRVTGFPKTEECKKQVFDFFREEVLQGKIEQAKNEIIMYWFEDDWESLLVEIFKGKNIWFSSREYYLENIDNLSFEEPIECDFEIKDAVTVALGEENYEFSKQLKEEMCSESPTVEVFSKNCFGIVAVKENKIIGWCLSEYNNDLGCEIGIGVNENFRRRGIATILGKKFFQEAKKRGLQYIGWSSFKNNYGSVNTALKLGLKKVKEYKSIYSEW